jgi:hypothetical protein
MAGRERLHTIAIEKMKTNIEIMRAYHRKGGAAEKFFGNLGAGVSLGQARSATSRRADWRDDFLSCLSSATSYMQRYPLYPAPSEIPGANHLPEPLK